ncbi:MAG: disulfide bond formation protein B [SAR324 cluster bacterium]|nr:disulfide bond formation protein B [SAR324 cluster bacterium]
MTDQSLPPENSTEQERKASWMLLFFAWLIAVTSMLGSLFFSEVMGVTPCVLCWYQRIAMYPLVFILPMGMFPMDEKVAHFIIPLPILGGLVALYHVALTWGLIPENMQPCTQGIPCSETTIELLGFLTIPLMSLASFILIAGLLIRIIKRDS